MTTKQLRDSLDQIKLFLRIYALASSKRREIGCGIVEFLAKKTPSLAGLDPEASPLFRVLYYCIHLLSSVQSRENAIPATSNPLIGVVDIKAIEALIELVCVASIRPQLSYGLLSSQLPNKILEDLDLPPGLSRVDTTSIIRHFMGFLQASGTVSSSIRRVQILSLLIAGAVEITYNPDFEDISTTLYAELVALIEPRRLFLSVHPLVRTICPTWALKVATDQMQQIVVDPGGLQLMIGLLTRPDDKGENSMAQFDRLSTIIAHCPVWMTLEQYLTVMLPRICEVLDDDSPTKATAKRAAIHIMRKLLSSPAECEFIVTSLWEPLSYVEVEFQDLKVQSALRRLCDLTAFSDLREPLLTTQTKIMFTAAFCAHEVRALDARGQLERLIYRHVEQDPEVSMLSGVLALMRNSQAAEDASSAEDVKARSSPVNYLCRIFDQVKLDGRPLMTVQHDLLSAYQGLEDNVLRSQVLQLTMIIPQQYAALFFSANFAEAWIKEFTNYFSRHAEIELGDLAIIYLNMMQVMLDVAPSFTQTYIGPLEKLIRVLSSTSYKDIDSDIHSTMQVIAQNLSLLVLRIKSVPSSAEKVFVKDNITVGKGAAKDRFAAAMQDLSDDMVPNRAHGLYMIGQLADSGVELELLSLDSLLPVMIGMLAEEEAFVYQNAIKALRKMIDAYGASVRDLLAKAQQTNAYSALAKERLKTALTLPDD